jgi:hypothetical protein
MLFVFTHFKRKLINLLKNSKKLTILWGKMRFLTLSAWADSTVIISLSLNKITIVYKKSGVFYPVQQKQRLCIIWIKNRNGDYDPNE